FKQVLEIDCVNQCALTISIAIDAHCFLDEGKGRAGAQTLGVDVFVAAMVLVGEQFEPLLGKIPGVGIEKGLVVPVKILELDCFQKATLGIIHPCQSIEVGEINQRSEEATKWVDRKHAVEHPVIEIACVPPGPIQEQRHRVRERFDDLAWQQKILIALGVHQEFCYRTHFRSEVGSEHRVSRKARIGFVVAEYPTKKCASFFRLLDRATVELVVDNADPGTDAGQCPYIECDASLSQTNESSHVQAGCRSAAAKRNRSFHLTSLGFHADAAASDLIARITHASPSMLGVPD